MMRGGSVKSVEMGEANENLIYEETGESSKGSFTRLIAMCKPEWQYGIGGVIGSMLAGCQNPAFALVIGEVLTAYYEPNKKMKSDVSTYALMLVAIGVSSLFIFVLQHYSLGVLGESLVMRVRERMFRSKYPSRLAL